MSIKITSNGVSKEYKYYPTDMLYINGQQAKEVFVNGVKCYPDYYPDGIVAVRGIERHPAGVAHAMPSPRNAICSEVVNQGSYELYQFAMGSYEISWAYLGILNNCNLGDVVIPQNGGGFQVAGGPNDRIRFDQYIARIKYIPNEVKRDELSADGQVVFDKITNGDFLDTNLIKRNRGTAWFIDNIRILPDYTNFTDCRIRVRLDYNDGDTSYSSHRFWTVFFYITTDLNNGAYIEGHERHVELFEPDNTSLLTESDLL